VLLAGAVDIPRWLRDDRRTPAPTRLERDRAIGRTIAAADPATRVLAWWSRLADEGHRSADSGSPTPGQRLESARRVAAVVLVVVGAVLGAGLAGVALAYDGRHPVNLFTLLGVLVGVPLLLLLLSLLLLLPRRLPGVNTLQSLAAGMSLGRWIAAWLDRWVDLDLFAPRGRAAVAGAFSRWQVLVFSQWLALAFFAGVLAVALLRVTFTDLAFGWSSTLEVDPARVQRWVAALSAPWAALVPAAAPEPALVEASRYFRLEDARLDPLTVQRLGAWWPFVFMIVLVYGALPRLLLLLLGAVRLRRATRRLLLDDPEVTALLDRMQSPLLALEGSPEEEVVEGPATPLPAPGRLPAGEGLALLTWNAAADAAAARRWVAANLGVQPAAECELAIVQTESEWRARLAAMAGSVDGRIRRVLVMTKGWEPPLLEFVDFLALLREVLGGDCSITVVPLGLDGEGVSRADREVWSRALGRVRDPKLYVQDADR
jgi:hypothetical protein